MRTDMDQLPSHESLTVGMFKYIPLGIIVSIVWKEFLVQSIHSLGTLLSAIIAAFLVYMANNFWFPKYFPKNGEWKFFKWLKP